MRKGLSVKDTKEKSKGHGKEFPEGNCQRKYFQMHFLEKETVIDFLLQRLYFHTLTSSINCSTHALINSNTDRLCQTSKHAMCRIYTGTEGDVIPLNKYA